MAVSLILNPAGGKLIRKGVTLLATSILAAFVEAARAEKAARELKETGLTEVQIDTIHEDNGGLNFAGQVVPTAKGFSFDADPDDLYSSFTSSDRRGLVGGRRILLTVVVEEEQDLPAVREIISRHGGKW